MPDGKPQNSENNGKYRDSVVNGNNGSDTELLLPKLTKKTSYLKPLLIVLFLVCMFVAAFVLNYHEGKETRNILHTAIAAWDEIPGKIGNKSRKADEPTTAEVQEEILRILAKDAGPAANSAVVDSRRAAAGQRALDLGGKALNDGQTDLALLYFINGINHDPGRMELVLRVAETALKSSNNGLCERAIGILELASMQVAPDDMAVVLAGIDELRARISPPPVENLSPEDADKRIREIAEAYDPGTIWSNGVGIVANKLSEIEYFLQLVDVSQLNGNDDRYSGAVKTADELTASLRNILTNLPLYMHINSCVDQMATLEKSDVPDVALFASLSASAQGVLSQVWGGMELLPIEMQEKFKAFPAQMKEIEANLQKKTSKAPFEYAIQLLDQAEADQKGNFTVRIKRIKDALDKVFIEADSITSESIRLTLFSRIRKTREKLTDLEIDQRAAYQKWALECSTGFLKEWNEQKIKTDDKAKRYFRKHRIAEIDETLLVPAVARILGRVMVCMTGELNVEDGSQIEYEMVSTFKKRMEDF